MKRITVVVILILIICSAGRSQNIETEKVASAIEMFRKAVIDADQSRLDQITAAQLVYGHSNGKVQNKQEFIEEIIGLQPNDYLHVEISDQTISISGNTAVVRHTYAAEYISNGSKGSLRIGNMLIWQKQSGNWRLLARQAYKL